MGFDLKNVFKKDNETLIIDRKAQALKMLIIFTCIVVLILILLVVVKNLTNVDEIRSKYNKGYSKRKKLC